MHRQLLRVAEQQEMPHVDFLNEMFIQPHVLHKQGAFFPFLGTPLKMHPLQATCSGREG